MSRSIFYSWQIDTPKKYGREFLRDVLEEVRANIVADGALDEALRDIDIDSDTQGVAGQPPIAQTIFKKIDAATVFVADMTFTGKRIDSRPTPNPNVLIEYGWALKSLTHERVICVMNDAYGEPSAESLPFDLAHLRWPIRYNLAVDATPEKKAEEKKKLIATLKVAIRMSLETVPPPQMPIVPPFPVAETLDKPARFRPVGESIGFIEDNFSRGTREVYLNPGSAFWLRLMPAKNPQKVWTTKELREIAIKNNSNLLPLIHGAGGYGHLRASDGVGMYRANGDGGTPNGRISTDSIAFAFKTGEIWAVEIALMNYDKENIYGTDTEKLFTEGLEMYSEFLKELGIDRPHHWEAGIIGAKGRRLGYAAPPGTHRMGSGPLCATDLIKAEGNFEEGQLATTALLPFFEKIFDECGIERPKHLPQ